MARYGKQSKRSPKQVLEAAGKFFGEGGLGLKVQRKDERNLYFVGGGGHVSIEAAPLDKGSDVTLETREWDFQVQEFMGKI